MNIYTDFWKSKLKEVISRISPSISSSFELPADELTTLGKRETSTYNGKLIVWVGKTEYNKDSAVFRDLKAVIDSTPQLVNKIPGELVLNVVNNNLLLAQYNAITFDLLVDRYKNIAEQSKNGELYKWKLVKSFQDNWLQYSTGKISIGDLIKTTDFRNLVFHNSLGVIKHMVRDKPVEFEQLLLALYDERIPLKERVVHYIQNSEALYFSLPGHGNNVFQDERTIATLLTFRYPDKYTFFKDSFYAVLAKGLGVKPAPKFEKLLHYYSIVEDFIEHCLPNHPDVIDAKNSLLDEACYPDNNNLLLAQDIFYETIIFGIALSDDAEEDTDYMTPPLKQLKKNAMSSLNTILYGPPGTGKTYHTINKAVAIANPSFNMETASRQQLKVEYERLIKEGQIEFVTFHQSMSYEDFIEGIKPVEPKEGDTFLKYEIRDGIFKRLAERATLVPEQKLPDFSVSDDEFAKASMYKISLGDSNSADDDIIFNWCVKNGYIALGWGDAIDFTGKSENEIQKMVPDTLEKYAAQAVNYFIHYIKQDDYVVVTNGNLKFRAIGKVTGQYEFKNIEGLRYHQFRKVQWLVKDAELPYESIYNRQFSQQSLYRLDKREIKKDYFVKEGKSVEGDGKQVKNYVLIIDEINRGNVSQIFGELITLIEQDKRAGNSEALSITLPYSKESFSVPANLYIVGTMNTADRSVEALDTALRRRFVFEEIMPLPDLLSPFYQLQRLWLKHWTAEEETDEWNVWLEDESNFIELTGMEKNEKGYEALSAEYNYENKEGEWMSTDPESLFGHICSFKDGINLAEVLTAINQRLEVLNNKDHQIGHAYFINCFSIGDVKRVFYKNIIPLLQEYFYGDYGKIGLVLGKGFVRQKSVDANQSVFSDFDYDASSFEDKIVYELVDYTNKSTYSIVHKNKQVEMTFQKAIKLLLKQDIE